MKKEYIKCKIDAIKYCIDSLNEYKFTFKDKSGFYVESKSFDIFVYKMQNEITKLERYVKRIK